MKHFMRLLFLAGLLLQAQPVISQVGAVPTVEYMSPPEWIDTIPYRQSGSPRISLAAGGTADLLFDKQLRWEGDDKLAHIRFVRQVVSPAGLEDIATISLDFDPARETVAIDRLRIVRGEKVIHLKNRVPISVFRRERNLEQGIVDGVVTLHMNLPDVRVGDIVDYAVLVRRKPYLPHARKKASMQMQWGVPVGRVRLSVAWPKGTPFHLALHGTKITHTVQDRGTTRLHVWSRQNVPGQAAEEKVPAGIRQYDRIGITEYDNWGQVAQELLPFYQQTDPLPLAWKDRVARIMRENHSAAARAIIALRLVQSEIRYVGIELGKHGYIARTPEQVVAARAGDCKDKARLLRAVLGAMGIDADVALANLNEGHTLATRLPGPGAFDHMIVGINLNGKTRWVDPTDSFQGGMFQNIIEPDLGYVLRLAPGVKGLEKIRPPRATQSSRWISEVFKFTFHGQKRGMWLAVRSTYQGGDADRTRAFLAYKGKAEVFRGYHRYYDGLYPGIEVTKTPVVEDDIDRNKISIVERYFLSAKQLIEGKIAAELPFVASDFKAVLPVIKSPHRRFPLATRFPLNFTHRVEVFADGIRMRPPDKRLIVNPAMRFRFHGSPYSEGGMFMLWKLVMRKRSIAPEQLPRARADIAEIKKISALTWNISAPLSQAFRRGGAYDKGHTVGAALRKIWDRAVEQAKQHQGKARPLSSN